jgi:WD40 repeat protein
MWNMITRCWSDERTARPTMASVCQELGACPVRFDYVEGLLQGHRDDVTSVAFSPDGMIIVSGSDDRTIIVWDAYSGNLVHSFHDHEDIASSVAFSMDGTCILSCCSKAVTKWDTHTGALMHKHALDIGGDIYIRAPFSTNGAQIVSGSFDGTVRILDAQSGAVMLHLNGHHNGVGCVAISPNGAHFASCSYGTMRIWDTRSGALVHCIEAHDESMDCVAFSPESTRIVSGSDDDTVRLWDVTSGTLIRAFNTHRNPVHSVAFSPDGTRIVSGCWDGTVWVWNAKTSATVYKLQVHTGAVNSVAFSPDGTHIISGSSDKAVGMWKVRW